MTEEASLPLYSRTLTLELGGQELDPSAVQPWESSGLHTLIFQWL